MPDKYAGMARREFLAAIGKAVGGSAMLRAMAAMGIGTSISACGSSSAASAPAAPSPPAPRPDSPRPADWPPNIGVGKSVVILGAGIAGMTAALEMTRLGYACTLLEARGSAGGRVLTLRAGDVVNEVDSSQSCQFDFDEDLYFNAGPSRIAQHHESLLGYCREFGVKLEAFTNDNRGAWLHSPGAFDGQPQVARRLLADTRGGIAELLSTAINQDALDQALTEADKANILAMLRQFGDLDINNSYSGTPRAGFPGQENVGGRQRGELLPARRLQDLVTEFFWELRLSFSQGFDQQPVMLQPAGGMDRIARAFESRVVDDIVFEAEVTEVRKTADGTRVIYEDRSGTSSTLEADYCIVTIPAPVLAGIANDFSAAHQAEIAGFQYSSAVRVAFQAPRFWEREHNIYGGITWTDQDITQIWYPNHGFQRETGILVGAYIFDGAAGNRFTDMPPATRIDTTTAQASNVHPQIRDQASNGISVAWKKMPFQRGGWGMSNPSVLLTADDSIVFAGEHLSILPGWQEGAILSAYSAIDQIVDRDRGA
ncbi:MAG: NAD(P)-binding protein [Gammaproteobacteria bacterium]|jgi:monoamine oxidase|nr:NAD(P)-binding protein [Gammaproteobacteria bacterium]